MESAESTQEQVNSWEPSCYTIQDYHSMDPEESRSGAHRQPPGDGASIVETSQNCSPPFMCSGVLTNPSSGALNGGLDNENSDLILAVNDVVINGETKHSYIIKNLLGKGTSGQVARCWSHELNAFVAIKIIKNQMAYRQQATVEIWILNMLNKQYDPEDKHHIVRILEHFMFKEHLCIVFEELSLSLLDVLMENDYEGISLNSIRSFTNQILSALLILRNARVIHCDLKPENIVLTTGFRNLESAKLKVIDFGSACMGYRKVESYIQTRYYRSPEVCLGHEYFTAIDMWSLGCIVAELFLGLPLFRAESHYDLLRRMIKILGSGPPDYLLRNAEYTSKYFKHEETPLQYIDNTEVQGTYQFLTPEEYEMREKTKPKIGKHVFPEDWNLEQVIMNYQMKRGMSLEDIQEEKQKRLVFIDFLKGLVHCDPLKRWTPEQASQHPFVTEKPFTVSFQSPLEGAILPNCQGGTIVDHDRVSGHWLGAGLSPQVNSNVSIFGSSCYDGQPFSYVSSYGSAASYGGAGAGDFGPRTSIGSYVDHNGYILNYLPPPPYISSYSSAGSYGGAGAGEFGPRTSIGSYGDHNWYFLNHLPPPPHVSGISHVGQLSASPGLRPVNLGMSPSSTFTPMHPGACIYGFGNPTSFTPHGSYFDGIGSPTSFTLPNSYSQSSPGTSTGSPRRYAPPSPARSSGRGARALGKAAVSGQLNKRQGWGSPHSGEMAHSGGQNLPIKNMNLTCHGAQQNFYPGSVETIPSSYSDGGSSLDSHRGFHHDGSHKPMNNGLVYAPVSETTETVTQSTHKVGLLRMLMSKAPPISTGGEYSPQSPDFVDVDENNSKDSPSESHGGDALASSSSTFLSPPRGGSGAYGLGLLINEGASGRVHGRNAMSQDDSRAVRLARRPLHYQWQQITPSRLGQQSSTQILPQPQNSSKMEG